MNELTIEEQLLIQLSRVDLQNTVKEQVIELIKNNRINWGSFTYLLFEHKTAVIVMRNLNSLQSRFKVHHKWRHIIEIYVEGIRIRNKFIRENMLDLLQKVNLTAIKCIPLKGFMLNNIVYNDLDIRHSNDVDLLVGESDLPKITKVLYDNGFIQGELKNNSLEKVSRSKIIAQRMHTHELIPFIKETGNPYCPHIIIDVQFDIFSRAQNMRKQFPLQILFETSKSYEAEEKRTSISFLCHEYNLMQLASHLFQDATMINSIRDGKDLELIKFIDIYEYVRIYKNSIDWCLLASLIKEYDLGDVIYYSIYFTEEIYGSIVPEDFLKKIKPSSLDYLEQFAFEENEPIFWNEPFIKRLLNPHRRRIIDLNTNQVSEYDKYSKLME